MRRMPAFRDALATITAGPAYRPRRMFTTSPGRSRPSAASRSDGGAVDGPLGGALGPVLPDVAERALGRLAGLGALRRSRSVRASSRTTSWSAWYWANDRLSRWRASSGVYARTRLAAMLYVGRNAERRLNDRLPASAATRSNGTNGLHSTTA